MKPPPDLDITERWRLLLGEAGPKFETAGTTIEENDAIRVWTLDGEVLIASIKTKMHAISNEVLDGILRFADLRRQRSRTAAGGGAPGHLAELRPASKAVAR